MKKLPYLIAIIAIAIAAMYATGYYNPYKSAYLKELDSQKKASEARELELVKRIDSLAFAAGLLQAQADSIQHALDVEEEPRKRDRDEFNKRMAQLSRLSTDSLPGYFAKRYNR